MSKTRAPTPAPFKTSHHRAYAIAFFGLGFCGLCAGLMMVLFTADPDTDPSWGFALGGVWLLAHWTAEWALAHKTALVTWSARWRARVEQAIPMGLCAAIWSLDRDTHLFATATQIIGGWVIFSSALILGDAAMTAIWTRLKAKRAARLAQKKRRP